MVRATFSVALPRSLPSSSLTDKCVSFCLSRPLASPQADRLTRPCVVRAYLFQQKVVVVRCELLNASGSFFRNKVRQNTLHTHAHAPHRIRGAISVSKEHARGERDWKDPRRRERVARVDNARCTGGTGGSTNAVRDVYGIAGARWRGCQSTRGNYGDKEESQRASRSEMDATWISLSRQTGVLTP